MNERTVRCPRCRQQFETLRRFQLECPDCGHEWVETSDLSLADRISDTRGEVFGTLVMGVMWAGMLFVLTLAAAALLLLLAFGLAVWLMFLAAALLLVVPFWFAGSKLGGSRNR